MTRNLFIAAGVLGVVWLGSFAAASFALDPENLGGRLGFYALGILAFVAGVLVLIIGLVRRSRAKS